MENIFGSVHYNSIAVRLKEHFGCRVVKLAVDGGFTCPNRDGSLGKGGCIYCSEKGSGDFASDIPSQIRLIRRKWPDAQYLAYFQSYTGTYASPEKLRRLWDNALSYQNVVGLAVATRPDCLPENVLDLISEYNERTYMWLELGLQTCRDDTAILINRCSKTETYAEAMEKLNKRGIKTVTHIIAGLPGETPSDSLKTALYAAECGTWGIKLHMLHVMEGTKLGEIYKRQQDFQNNLGSSPKPYLIKTASENSVSNIRSDDFPPVKLLSMNEYVNLAADIIERLPQSVTIHRLTGDAPKNALLAPEWTGNKHVVLGAIQHTLAARGSFQGAKYSTDVKNAT